MVYSLESEMHSQKSLTVEVHQPTVFDVPSFIQARWDVLYVHVFSLFSDLYTVLLWLIITLETIGQNSWFYRMLKTFIGGQFFSNFGSVWCHRGPCAIVWSYSPSRAWLQGQWKVLTVILCFSDGCFCEPALEWCIFSFLLFFFATFQGGMSYERGPIKHWICRKD